MDETMTHGGRLSYQALFHCDSGGPESDQQGEISLAICTKIQRLHNQYGTVRIGLGLTSDPGHLCWAGIGETSSPCGAHAGRGYR